MGNCLTHYDQHFYGIAKADTSVRKACYIQHRNNDHRSILKVLLYYITKYLAFSNANYIQCDGVAMICVSGFLLVKIFTMPLEEKVVYQRSVHV